MSFVSSEMFALDENKLMCNIMAMKEHPLRTWRTSQDMTLKAAAKTLGLSISQLCEIELRVAKPSAQRAAVLMRKTGLSIEQVLGQ
jgi:hypothetical protein